MSSRSRWIVLILAAAGLAFATASAWVHYKILTDPSYHSPCDMSSTFNCSQVYMSKYGTVSGVPVALFGMFWFALVGLVALVSPPSTGKAPKAGFGATLQVLSVIGLAVVFYLGLTSWFVLKAACILCMGTYVAVIGIFLAVVQSSAAPMSQMVSGVMNEIGPFAKKAGVAIIVLVGATAFAAVKFPREGTLPPALQVGVEGLTKEAIDSFAAAWNKMPRVSLGLPDDGARVHVVKFNDFLCPSCAYSHNLYKQVFEKFDRTNPGVVKYVLKDWPWNAKCNPAVGNGGPNHLGACEAAVAARIAHEQGRDAEERMRDWLYNNLQQQSPPSAVKAGAESVLGIKGPDFDAQYERKLPDIRQDVALGQALRINGTPTFFINGVRFTEMLPPAYFELAIQLELNKK